MLLLMMGIVLLPAFAMVIVVKSTETLILCLCFMLVILTYTMLGLVALLRCMSNVYRKSKLYLQFVTRNNKHGAGDNAHSWEKCFTILAGHCV